MAYFIYDLILIIVMIIASPYIAFLLLRGRYREGFLERLGFLPGGVRKDLTGERVVWVHAASVGEVKAAVPLVSSLKDSHPNHLILFTTVSDTGRETAREILDESDVLIYLPLDISFIVKRVMDIVRPELLVLVETELWPNLIRNAEKTGARIVVASGRISDASHGKYRYLAPLFRSVLSSVDYFAMQTELDADRIESMGAPPEKVDVVGNIKYDALGDESNLEKEEELRSKLGIRDEEIVFVAGSTHEGEERQLLTVYHRLRQKFPRLLMVLAPRYIERAEEIAGIYHEAGINTVCRSEFPGRKRKNEGVIILDSLGELTDLYGLADLVFIGGSLVPVGGHNILEAADKRKLPFFGPYMNNIKKDVRYFTEKGAAVQVENKEELLNELAYHLEQEEMLREKSARAAALIEESQGAVADLMDVLGSLLGGKGRHILLIRLSAIGDVIHALPAAAAVRKAYPRAEISWLVEGKAYGLVEMNPYLDRVIYFPKSEWKRKFKDRKISALCDVRDYFRKLQKYDFDILLDLHGLLKSGIAARFSGTPIRYGPADGREGSTLFYTHKLRLADEALHQVERNLALAEASGGEPGGKPDYGLQIDPAVEERIEKLICEKQGESYPEDPLVAINPYTTWESKNWPGDRYARVGDRLVGEYGCRVVYTGGPGEREGIERILDWMDNEVLNLAGETDLQELAVLYKRADLFIGGDTGPMHLAAAVETPVVAIMGPTLPETHGPYGEGHIVLREELECSGCWKRKCPRNNECLRSITVEDVLRAAAKICLNDGEKNE
ncbi:MAG: glycosyltransferase N-terminal domain-containing protein [Halanaerobiaceae bacterium]